MKKSIFTILSLSTLALAVSVSADLTATELYNVEKYILHQRIKPSEAFRQ